MGPRELTQIHKEPAQDVHTKGISSCAVFRISVILLVKTF